MARRAGVAMSGASLLSGRRETANLQPDFLPEADRSAIARAWIRQARGRTELPIQTLEALEVIAFRALSQPGRSPQQIAADEHEALVYIASALADILRETGR